MNTNTKEQNHPPVMDRISMLAGQHIGETAEQIRETATQASEGLEESLDNIRMKFNDVRDTVTDTSKQYSRSVNDYVSKNPWVAIGISAGCAFLAGMLIGRRRDY